MQLSKAQWTVPPLQYYIVLNQSARRVEKRLNAALRKHWQDIAIWCQPKPAKVAPASKTAFPLLHRSTGALLAEPETAAVCNSPAPTIPQFGSQVLQVTSWVCLILLLEEGPKYPTEGSLAAINVSKDPNIDVKRPFWSCCRLACFRHTKAGS